MLESRECLLGFSLLLAQWLGSLGGGRLAQSTHLFRITAMLALYAPYSGACLIGLACSLRGYDPCPGLVMFNTRSGELFPVATGNRQKRVREGACPRPRGLFCSSARDRESCRA